MNKSEAAKKVFIELIESMGYERILYVKDVRYEKDKGYISF